ncbi:YopX family protein [Staphylococcus aureus]|uniref:YopX family protein n=1 Tax=Staphylococcus aureus TaxID=1280 RepID=UPI0020BD5964|nr:YopX family protein [Staphylococcus aureus]
MKIINLRIWDKEEKEMYEDFLRFVTEDEINHYLPYHASDALAKGDQSRYVGQLYTGNDDMEGTPLYDGDIIHITPGFNGSDLYAEIYWKGTGYALRSDRLDSSSGYLEMVLPHAVRIGDIYRNPELKENLKG